MLVSIVAGRNLLLCRSSGRASALIGADLELGARAVCVCVSLLMGRDIGCGVSGGMRRFVRAPSSSRRHANETPLAAGAAAASDRYLIVCRLLIPLASDQ